MISMFNRRELVTVASSRMFFNIRAVLTAAGIAVYHKTNGNGKVVSLRSRGSQLGLDEDGANIYTISVNAQDYDRACKLIQPILQGEEREETE